MLIVDNQLVTPPDTPISTTPEPRDGGVASSALSFSQARGWRQVASWIGEIAGGLCVMALPFLYLFLSWGFSK